MLNILFSLIWLLTWFFIPTEHRAEMTPSLVSHGQSVQEGLRKVYGELPLSFEANRGQADPDVKFLSRGQGYTLLLKSNEAVLALQRASFKATLSSDHLETRPDTHQTNSVLRMRLVGANPSPRVSGNQRLPGKSNYFIGRDPARWRTNIPTYQKVRYESVYPGVDLLYYGRQGQLEYDFVLAPGANPEQIRLRFEGGRAQIDAQADLVVAAEDCNVVFRKPSAYQPDREDVSARHLVAAGYVLEGHNQVSFRVSSYDRQRPLIIDPMLSYSTYLGGNYGDTANGIALDSSGNAYVTGSTSSTNFPTSSAHQSANAGETDVFVAKLASDGASLEYSTYLGGADYDSGNAIAVDSSGNAYITGTTSSSDFPTGSSVFQGSYGGASDAFVVKLNSAGSELTFASYLGGSENDYGQGIALDPAGNAYVTGLTESSNFPTVNSFQGGNDGGYDVFVAKVNNPGSALIFSTYLGGASADCGRGIAVDSSGNAYVTGYTYSSNFPIANPYQGVNAGSADAFVAKLSSGGSTLLYATYLGGTDLDRGMAIALDASGNIYLTGDTRSTGFPVTLGAFQVVKAQDDNNGVYQEDAFVTKLNPTGSQLIYSTYLGASGSDRGAGIAVDSLENTYIVGFTQSRDFPTANPLQASFGGGTCGYHPCADAFITKLNPQGTALLYSTFLGGSRADFGSGIRLDSSGNAYVAGSTASANFTPTAGAYQGAPGDTPGNGDAFVAKIGHTNAPAVALNPQKITFDNQAIDTTSDPETVTLTNVGTVPLSITDISASGDFAQTNDCLGTVPASGGRCTIRITFTPTVLQTQTGEITISDDASGSPHEITVTGTGVNPSTEVELSPESLEFANQTVGSTSPPQTVTLTNTGDTDLAIESISTSGDFAQTNNCPVVMGVGASCTIRVTFTPTGSGTRTGSLTITDNAPGGSQGVSLKGVGTAIFSLAVANPSQTILIGSASTTFTISAVAPSGFTESISLSCASGATCSFDPTSVEPGESSTVTVSGLTASTANPFNFTVNGTSDEQTASLSLVIFFADFTMSASPTLNSTAAGQSVTYTVTVTPLNGFNQAVLLSCSSGLPDGGSCTFSPSAVAPDGSSPVTSTLTVSTTARSSVLMPRWPSRPKLPRGTTPVMVLGLWACLALAISAGQAAHRRRLLLPAWNRARLALASMALSAIILSTALMTGCDSGYYTNIIQPAETSGSQVGNYTITIQGTLGGGTLEVTRTTTVNLAVS